jgi:hypothetical protein
MKINKNTKYENIINSKHYENNNNIINLTKEDNITIINTNPNFNININTNENENENISIKTKSKLNKLEKTKINNINKSNKYKLLKDKKIQISKTDKENINKEKRQENKEEKENSIKKYKIIKEELNNPNNKINLENNICNPDKFIETFENFLKNKYENDDSFNNPSTEKSISNYAKELNNKEILEYLFEEYLNVNEILDKKISEKSQDENYEIENLSDAISNKRKNVCFKLFQILKMIVN